MLNRIASDSLCIESSIEKKGSGVFYLEPTVVFDD